MSTTREGANGAITGLGPRSRTVPTQRERSHHERSLRPTSRAQLVRRWVGVLGVASVVVGGIGYVVDRAIKDAQRPLPVGCEVMVRPRSNVSEIARQIANHPEFHTITGDVVMDIQRVNPDIDVGQVDEWQSIDIPARYCTVIQDDAVMPASPVR